MVVGVCEFCGAEGEIVRHHWYENGDRMEAGVCNSCNRRLNITTGLAEVFGGKLPPRRVQEIFIRMGGDFTPLFREVEAELGRLLSYSEKTLIAEKKTTDRDTVGSALKILGKFRRRISRLEYFAILPSESSVRVMGHILDIEEELGNGR